VGKSSHLFKLLMSVQSVNDYRIQDPSTDPGKYKYMYADLPESLVDLGNIVQNQLVHPWNGGEQPEGRRYEPRNNSRVEDILGQLEALNDQGLSMLPGERSFTDFYSEVSGGSGAGTGWVGEIYFQRPK
jgi:hypothetical protein